MLQIFYTGNIAGNFEPCGCKIPKGGVARRVTFMEKQRIEGARELRIDVGNFTDLQADVGSITTDCIAHSFQMLDYHAVGVSRRELSFDITQLQRLAKDYQLPIVSANVLHPITGNPMFEPYRIINLSGMKVTCLGLTDEFYYKYLENTEEAPFGIQPVFEAAETWIPEAAKASDFLVIMTDMNYYKIDTLASRFPDIDVVVTSGVNPQPIRETVYSGAVVVRTFTMGYRGTLLNIDFDKTTGDTLIHRWISQTLTEDFEPSEEFLKFEKECKAKVVVVTGEEEVTPETEE
jgi:2',3'-cyclic-nucleotide 2'-phosphodiesterase (5'-nucleotidase family)